MTSPRQYLSRMLLFLIAVAVAIGVLAPHLYDAFLANPALNGLIVGVMFLGIIYIFFTCKISLLRTNTICFF